MTKVGVFDSGIGGKSLAQAIENKLPNLDVVWLDDKENMPYGDKSFDDLIRLVVPKLKQLESNGCDVIVVACNSITTTIISKLRDQIAIPIVGIEPMIKPACALTKSKVVAVFATPVTVNSRRFNELVDTYAQGIKILKPDCSSWALAIENNTISDESIIKNVLEVCEQGADVIILGCTHYHWISNKISDYAKKYRTQVIHPEAEVIKRLSYVIDNFVC